MDPEPERTPGAADNGHGGLFALAAAALVVGAASGLVGAAFRLALEQADRLRNGWVAQARDWGLAGLALVVAACSAATALAAWMVRRHAPYAAGSGIPHVEAVLGGE